MKKITTPRVPEEEDFIYTEGINYFELGSYSIWGRGDKDILNYLKSVHIKGRWLNLAAGDGRYNRELLSKASYVTAADIDKSALSKLWHLTPPRYRQKLQIETLNILNKFPFPNDYFDGVFCVGTLHYFPKSKLEKIFLEIKRVLAPNGTIILDFAADVKRVLHSGKLLHRKGTPKYTLKTAEKMLTKMLKDFDLKIIESKVPPENVQKPNLIYKFSCKLFLLEAKPR